MKTLSERIEKLPKWAQAYIAKLQRDVQFWKKAAGQIANSDKAMISWRLLRESVGIPDRATVAFQLETGAVEISMRDNMLYVHSERCLIIYPVAANAVRIIVESKRRERLVQSRLKENEQ